MIAITTDRGTLRIAAEIDIPNGQEWGAGRITQLIAGRFGWLSPMAIQFRNVVSAIRTGRYTQTTHTIATRAEQPSAA